MTGLRKVSSDQLEREYVFADPPISITQLADRHQLARSGVADKARIGEWYRKREEFRSRVDASVAEAMAEKWAEMQIMVYERLMKISVKNLDIYEKAQDEPDFKVPTKDMIAVASMMRTLFEDVARKPVAERQSKPVEGGTEYESEAEAIKAIEEVRRLMAGGANGDTSRSDAGGNAAQGPEDAGED